MSATFLRKYATAVTANTAYAVRIPIIKRGVVDYAVGADWTPSAGDVKVTVDGGSTANIATLPTAVTYGNTALWEFIFSSGELTGKTIAVAVADSATKAVEDQSFIVETFGHASAMYPNDYGVASLPAVAAGASGGLPVIGTGSNNFKSDSAANVTVPDTQKVDVNTVKTNPVVNAGTVTFPTNATLASTTNITAGTVTTATNVTTVNGLAANVITAASIADGAIDRATFAADTGLQPIRSGTAQGGSTTTLTLDSGASAETDFYLGQWLRITGGAGAGQCQIIRAYDGSTKVATVGGAGLPTWHTTPDGTSTFAVLPHGGVNVQMVRDDPTIATGLATLSDDYFTNNYLTAVVAAGGITSASFAAGSITATALAAGAFTAAKFAAGAINAAALAADTGLKPLASGTDALGSSATTFTDNSGPPTTLDGALILVTGGTGANQAPRLLYGYGGGVYSVAPAWATTPDNTSSWVVVPAGPAAVELWKRAVPGALISGNVPANAQAAGTDAVSAAAVSTAAVTKIQAGLATAGSAMTLAAGAISDATFTVPAEGTYAGPVGWLRRLYRRWYNRTVRDATTIKVYRDNGTVVDATSAYTASGNDEDIGAAT